MLTPEYLDGLPEPILELYAQAEDDILSDMARRISTYDYWIPSADWQNQKLLESGRVQEEIIRILAEKTGRTEAELKKLMQQAAKDGLRIDKAIYEEAGRTVPPLADNEALRAILNAGYRATAQTMKNITRTTAVTASQQFERVLDEAWLKVTSGAFSTDEAVRSAVKDLSAQGVKSIQYASGREYSLEAAVRRAVVTGVNQTCGKLQLELADELGCDLMEITAHAGARPSHAVWQGQIVSRSGQPGYLTFEDIGYGTVGGFKGANCRHDWNPYFEGMPRTWTEEKLRELNEPRYTYNGKQLTEYEAQQTQRYHERQIRRWKREYVAMKAAGQDTTEAAVKLQRWQERQKDFLSQTGLKRSQSREGMAGFGQKESMAARNESSAVGNINLYRRQKNTGAFADLPEKMSKKHIRETAKEFDISLKHVKINIDKDVEKLDPWFPYTGRADPQSIGQIDFFPKAFRSREELLRTLFHERIHVMQFREYGAEYVQNNRSHFEVLAYEAENEFITKLKEAGRL